MPRVSASRDAALSFVPAPAIVSRRRSSDSDDNTNDGRDASYRATSARVLAPTSGVALRSAAHPLTLGAGAATVAAVPAAGAAVDARVHDAVRGAPEGVGVREPGWLGGGRARADAVVVAWLRAGESLRLDDNPALLAAVREGERAAAAVARRRGGGRAACRPRVALVPVFVATCWDADGRVRCVRGDEVRSLRESLAQLHRQLCDVRSALVVVEAGDGEVGGEAGTEADEQRRAEAAATALRRLVDELDRDALHGVYFARGATSLQRSEERALARMVQQMNEREGAQAPREFGARRRRRSRVVCRGVDAGNALHDVDALPVPLSELPEDCDAYARMTASLAVEAPSDAPTELPPLPDALEHAPSLGKCIGRVPEPARLGVATMEERAAPGGRLPAGGERNALARLDDYIVGRATHASVHGDSVGTYSGHVLGCYLSAGCLSPRRVWKEVMERVPEESLRRHCVRFDLQLRDFVRMMTLKRGVHPA